MWTLTQIATNKSKHFKPIGSRKNIEATIPVHRKAKVNTQWRFEIDFLLI